VRFLQVLTFVFLTTSSAWAARPSASPSATDLTPKGVRGYAGFGVVNWTVLEPDSARFRFDQGTFATLGGERGFGFLNLYLNFSLAYMRGAGQVNYDYSNLSGEHYTGSDVNFNMDLFEAGLGLKLKLIDGFWFRPYIEGGGTAGYFTITYTNLSQKLTSQLTGNYKTSDSLLSFSRYTEAGLEIDFSDTFRIRPTVRFISTETKPLVTLAEKRLHYEAAVYYLALLVQF
jgi:hypothetical protein